MVQFPALFITLMMIIGISFILLIINVIMIVIKYEEMKKVFFKNKWHYQIKWVGSKSFESVAFSINDNRDQDLYFDFVKFRNRAIKFLALIAVLYVLVFLSQSQIFQPY